MLTSTSLLASSSSDFASGMAAGVCGVLAGHPLDTVKVRLQTSYPRSYNGALDCITSTFRREGPRAFYRGISFPIASKGLEQCLAFGVNSCARRALADSQIDCVHPDTVLGKVTAGAVVGVVNSIVSTPVELVKIKLQTQGANSSSIAQSLRTAAPSGYSRAVPYRGSFHCALSIINSEGLVGLYRGFPAAFMAQSIAYSVRFYIYDVALQNLVSIGNSLQQPNLQTMQMLPYSRSDPSEPMIPAVGSPPGCTIDNDLDITRPQQQHHNPPAWASLGAGAISGAALWAMVYPIDVLKSKIQAGRELDYSCFSRGLKTLLSSSHLPSAMYKGLMPCLVRGATVNAIMFLAFEQTKTLLHGLTVADGG